MSAKKSRKAPANPLAHENKELRAQLAEAQETLRAIHEGEVDAVIVSGSQGEQVFSLVGAESVYRLIVETMKEAAFTVAFDGRILFCNAQFGQFVERPMEQIVGHSLNEFVKTDRATVSSLLAAAKQQPVKQRLVFQTADGAAVPAHVAANVLSQPDGLSICVVASDLRELENSTELIQQLRRQHEALQAANEELAAADEEMRVQNEELTASKSELDRTRAKYQDLFESAPDGYVVTDAEGTIQEMNHAAAMLLGKPGATLKGNPFPSLLLSEAARQEYLELLATLHSGAAPAPKLEVEVRSLEGRQFWASVTAAASRDEEGSIVGLRWLIHDISHRKATEESLHQYIGTLQAVAAVREAALTCATEKDLGVACLDIAQKVTGSKFGFIGQVNEQGLEDIAISNPGWDACNILDIGGHRQSVSSLKIHGIYGRVLLDGKTVLTNDPAKHPDRIGLPPGHPPLDAFLGVPLISEGKTIGMIGMANRPGGYAQGQQEALETLAPAFVEAFMRKQAEEALRQAKEELEQRVQERTAELRHRSQQLSRVVSELALTEQRERGRLAQVLHDGLQQLLVGAKFHLAVLERSGNAAMGKAIAGIMDLLDDSIETSRSLTAELSPPILHQGGLVPAMEWLARWMQEKHGLTIALSAERVPDAIGEDALILLFQATRELLFNVVKHAGVKSAAVRVGRFNGAIQITVADDGAGFDPGALTAEDAAGGYGLFSIKERLDLLGGSMEVDSAPGRGSRFTLIAPVAASGTPESLPPQRPASLVSVSIAPREQGTEGKIRVILVDDHVVMRQGLATLLKEEPDMVVIGEASDGESAVSLVRELGPDVVLMDVSMPGMNGIEAARILHAELPAVRIIGLSMFEQDEQAQAMLDAGASDYLTKSGPSEHLIAAIRGETSE
ncbi:MAG: response regulator [Planctomycetaceae bacterium]|nr:response regulator [Planctomycetaceae bacterium]